MERRLTGIVALACLLGVVGCAGSDDAVDDSGSPDETSSSPTDGTPAPTTTISAPTTIAPTTSGTTPPTTVPTTTTSTVSVPTTITPTTDSTPPTTSAAAAGAIDASAATIFGLHLYAERPSDDVVTVVSDRLGTPTSDTGFLPMPEEFACTGSPAFRTVRWGDLRMTFTQGSTVPDATEQASEPIERLLAWAVGDESAEMLSPSDEPPANPSPTGLTTAEGVGIGSSRADLANAYAEHVLGDIDDDRVSIFVSGSGSQPTSFTFDGNGDSGDVVIGIGSGPLDCIDPDETR